MLPEFRYFSKNFRGKIANFAKSLFINSGIKPVRNPVWIPSLQILVPSSIDLLLFYFHFYSRRNEDFERRDSYQIPNWFDSWININIIDFNSILLYSFLHRQSPGTFSFECNYIKLIFKFTNSSRKDIYLPYFTVNFFSICCLSLREGLLFLPSFFIISIMELFLNRKVINFCL